MVSSGEQDPIESIIQADDILHPCHIKIMTHISFLKVALGLKIE